MTTWDLRSSPRENTVDNPCFSSRGSKGGCVRVDITWRETESKTFCQTRKRISSGVRPPVSFLITSIASLNRQLGAAGGLSIGGKGNAVGSGLLE